MGVEGIAPATASRAFEPPENLVKVPHCACCHLELGGNLVAAHCNCVFHRKCAPAADENCPQCGRINAGRALLDLYGVSFGTSDSSKATAAKRTAKSLAERTGPEALASREGAVALCELQQQVDDERRSRESMEGRVKASTEAKALKAKKLDDVEKKITKLTKKQSEGTLESEQAQAKHAELCLQIQQNRQRGAILEYREIMRAKSAAEALAFLNKMVAGSLDPVPMLIELSRLRDYYRKQLVEWQRQGAATRQKDARLRLEIDERQRSITELKQKLQRRAGDAAVERVVNSCLGDDGAGTVSRGGARQPMSQAHVGGRLAGSESEADLSQTPRLPATPSTSQASSQGTTTSTLFPSAKRTPTPIASQASSSGKPTSLFPNAKRLRSD